MPCRKADAGIVIADDELATGLELDEERLVAATLLLIALTVDDRLVLELQALLAERVEDDRNVVVDFG
jgi:hypothetical protein